MPRPYEPIQQRVLPMNVNYICSRCHRKFAVNTLAYKCQCSGAFELEKKLPKLSVGRLKSRANSIWRYREVLQKPQE